MSAPHGPAPLDAGGRRLRLQDGRHLGWTEFGDPNGDAILYFHGFPGSRIEASLAASIARTSGVRLIAVDRPGFGLSDYLPGRRIADWPRDVAELVDSLGIERFAALGVSGGGPYLLALARALPERLFGAGVLCGLGPLEGRDATRGMVAHNRIFLGLAQRLPISAQLAARVVAVILDQAPGYALARLEGGLPAPDREVFAHPEMRRAILATWREAVVAGPRGAARELVLFSRPWGFALEEIAIPIHLWHGEIDTVVPVALGRRVAARVPRARPRFFPDEGHFSLPTRHLGAMFDALRADQPRSRS